MAVRPQGDALHLRVAAARATIPLLLKADCAKAGTKAQVVKHGGTAPVDVHSLVTIRAQRGQVPLQLSTQQVDLPARLGDLYDGGA